MKKHHFGAAATLLLFSFVFHACTDKDPVAEGKRLVVHNKRRVTNRPGAE